MKANVIRVETAPGLSLVGEIHGAAGHPVIFLHGGGQTRHSWRKTADALAQNGLVALPFDQRGHGDSGRPTDRGYTFFDFARDAQALGHAVKQRFGLSPAVVGASLGGMSGLLATDLPGGNPFSALVLVDVTPRMDPKGVAAVQGFMRDKSAEGFANVEEAAAAIAAYLPHRPKPKSLDGLRKNLKKAPDGRLYWHWDPAFLDGPSPIETNRAGVEATALKAAGNLKIPSLLVRGGSSELVRQDQAEEYLRIAPHSQFVDVKDARHMVAGDSNSAFTAAVLAFLKDKLTSR